MSRLMPTSASRHSKDGHRKTTAPFWVQKRFHILQQSPWTLPEPPPVGAVPVLWHLGSSSSSAALPPARSRICVSCGLSLPALNAYFPPVSYWTRPSIKNAFTSTLLSPVVGEMYFPSSSAPLCSGAWISPVFDPLRRTLSAPLCQPSVNQP